MRWAGPDGPGLDREGGGRGSSRNLWDHAKRVLSFPLPLNPPPRSNTAIVSERSSSPHLATLFSSDPFQAHCWIGKCLRMRTLFGLVPGESPFVRAKGRSAEAIVAKKAGNAAGRRAEGPRSKARISRPEGKAAGFNRRIRKTVCPVVWEGAGAQSPALDPIVTWRPASRPDDRPAGRDVLGAAGSLRRTRRSLLDRA